MSDISSEEITFNPVRILGLEFSPDTDQIFNAIFTIQSEIKPVEKTRDNTYTGSKYADLADVWQTLQPFLKDHRLLVMQMPGREMVTKDAVVLTRVTHLPSGQWVQWSLSMPGGNTSQSVGSAITYGSRYALVGFFRMIAVGDDDDGNASTQGQRQTQQRKQSNQPRQQQGQQGQGQQGVRQVAPVITWACDKQHQAEIEKVIADGKANKMSDADFRMLLPEGRGSKYKLNNQQAEQFVKDVSQAIVDIQNERNTSNGN